jgi:hypothetical protein
MEIHIDKACETDGKPDIVKINPIVYAQATYFAVGNQTEKAFSGGTKYEKK